MADFSDVEIVVYHNEEKGQFRFLLPEFNLVVKTFADTKSSKDLASIKFWTGDIKTVADKWNMVQTDLEPTSEQLTIIRELALGCLSKIEALRKSYL